MRVQEFGRLAEETSNFFFRLFHQRRDIIHKNLPGIAALTFCGRAKTASEKPFKHTFLISLTGVDTLASLNKISVEAIDVTE